MWIRWLLVALLGIGLAGPLAGARAQEARIDYGQIIKSSVMLLGCNALKAPHMAISRDILGNALRESLAAFKQAEEQDLPPPMEVACSHGSGTVIDPGGRILTNGHVAIDMAATATGIPAQVEPIWMLVHRTTDSRSLPEPMFFAYAVTWSPVNRLDLAVLVPAYGLDGTPLQPGDISLPPLPMAPAESVDIGDPLVNIGYPGIGGRQITLLEGVVAGFANDDRLPQMGAAAWIKTDSTLGGGISGGTSLNTAGQLVGVPTRVGDIENRWENGKLITTQQINFIRPIPEALAVLAEIGKGEPIGADGLPVVNAAPAQPVSADQGGPPASPATPAPEQQPPAAGEEPRQEALALAAFVTGRVVSADTGKGIGAAQVLVLEPGMTIAQYRAGQTGFVHAFAITAADGSFTLPKQVTVGEAYGVLVMAAGFRSAEQDGVVLAPEGSGTAVTIAPFSLARRR